MKPQRSSEVQEAVNPPYTAIKEIVSAAKAVHVDFFARTMRKRCQTVLFNDTGNVSVGQKKLLTVARVVLCNPSVPIPDAATSSVNPRTEIEINRTMRALMENWTGFVIIHRLSTIVNADLILVMEQGNIITAIPNHRA